MRIRLRSGVMVKLLTSDWKGKFIATTARIRDLLYKMKCTVADKVFLKSVRGTSWAAHAHLMMTMPPLGL